MSTGSWRRPSSDLRLYIRPKTDIDAGERDAFELMQFSVDGNDRLISQSARPGWPDLHHQPRPRRHQRRATHQLPHEPAPSFLKIECYG